MRRVILIFITLSACLYGIIASTQILAVLGWYKPWLEIPLAVLFTLAILWWGRPFTKSFIQNWEQPEKKTTFVSNGLLGAGLVLFLLVVLLPLFFWPYSPISETLTWDAGLYHFPKAVELYRTGSVWDMTLSYADYPFGYESLLAFTFCLVGSPILFGGVHAVIALYFFLALWLVSCRFTRLDQGLLCFLTSVLLISGIFPVDSNIFGVLKDLLHTIGKNDVLVGAAILSCILFSPSIGSVTQKHSFYMEGLAIQSMIALSIKPNSALILLFIWIWVLFLKWQPFNKNDQNKIAGLVRPVLGCILVVIPGTLWVFRNLILLQSMVSKDALAVQGWSILAHLTDPRLYLHIPLGLKLIGLIWVLYVLYRLLLKKGDWSSLAFFSLLIVGFAATPASAFASDTQERAEIAWRFAVALLGFTFVVGLALVEPWLKKILSWMSFRVWVQWGILLAAFVFSGWVVWDQSYLFNLSYKNEIVLHDAFREPVGRDGYWSVYDYVQKNVRDSVVYIENGLPFYVYDRNLTNSTTRSRPADYWVMLRDGDGNYPEFSEDEGWLKKYQLVYSDAEGQVFTRK